MKRYFWFLSLSIHLSFCILILCRIYNDPKNALASTGDHQVGFPQPTHNIAVGQGGVTRNEEGVVNSNESQPVTPRLGSFKSESAENGFRVPSVSRRAALEILLNIQKVRGATSNTFFSEEDIHIMHAVFPETALEQIKEATATLEAEIAALRQDPRNFRFDPSSNTAEFSLDDSHVSHLMAVAEKSVINLPNELGRYLLNNSVVAVSQTSSRPIMFRFCTYEDRQTIEINWNGSQYLLQAKQFLPDDKQITDIPLLFQPAKPKN